MTKVLGDIINKRHDQEACRFNCLENGKAFNQAPHHCPYFSNDFKYANLLEHKDGKGEDLPDAAIKSNNPKVAEYCWQLIQFEDLKDEVDIGVRNQDDLVAQQEETDNL